VSETLDTAGNTTRSGNKRMVYSANNRFTRFRDVSTGVVANYYHNGLGQRAAKSISGSITLYVYDLSGNFIIIITALMTQRKLELSMSS